ncbi:sensor histidine kinase [Paenibacillus sp. MWE-103]|uniref:Sensor histidine kinase n=1 Tax=Paenibacillus artemisiicola TaxID=1172618 RepID=A0ABS3WFR7_9BACL|nr:sensor histidine kinase [Paenibacillus artemisiicola]MBO7747167.1 sensor histidine kinase [Paenibacillus artemisiicola]
MRTGRPFIHQVNDIPLNTKFLLIYLLCVLLPIMTINLFFFHQNSENIRVREQDNLRKSIERASGELLGMIDESVALSHSIASDDSIYAALDRAYASPVDYYAAYDGFLRDKLKRYMSSYPNIVEIRVYTDNPTIQTGANYHVIGDPARDLPWLGELKRSASNMTVVSYYESGGFSPGNRISVVSRLNTYASYATYTKYLRIDLNPEKIQAILNREIDSLRLRLIDDGNQIVAIGDGAPVQQQAQQPGQPTTPQTPSKPDAAADAAADEAVAHARPGYAMERPLGDFGYVKGWKLVGIADTRRVDGLMNDARRSIIWLAVVSTFIPSLLIYVILRSYHYRVKKLSRHMLKVRNERFDPIDMHEGRDEIGGLIRTFNVMTEKITSLINDVYKLEIRQKSLELERVRTELSMLQSQMNPHFLFNTLNALLVVCTKNGYSDVTEIIRNLSVLMRQLLSRADGLVPLQEELQFTAMYLQIEKFRFGQQFEYAFDVDPRALPLRIPRMSIQPLVENACKHGLQARKGSRTIRVTAAAADGALDIRIADNGVGMEEARLRQLLTDVRSEQQPDGQHVGIRNVLRRLELFYGGAVRFRMTSDPATGTEAGFQIPLARLEAEEWKREA